MTEVNSTNFLVNPNPRKPLLACGPSAPFWDGVANERLMLQHDAELGRWHFYVKPAYDSNGKPLGWREATGLGAVVAYTVSRVAAPGFEAQTPNLLALVKLDEGPRIFTSLIGCTEETVRIGLRVRIRFGEAALPAPFCFEIQNDTDS